MKEQELEGVGFTWERDEQLVSPCRKLWLINRLEFNEGFYCNQTGKTFHDISQVKQLLNK